MKRILMLVSILLISTFLLALTAAHEETKKVCSSSIIDSTIDGYRIEDAKGNFEGKVRINEETGKLIIKAQGASTLNEKITLESDMEITSVVESNGNYFFEGYASKLTISEGNGKKVLKNVPMVLHWNTKQNVVYIGYTHFLLEETAITWKQSC